MKYLRILVYDTNFVKGISRVIPILKIKYWQKNNCKITILCTKEGESFYKSVLKDVDFITLDYVYKIKNAYSLPWEYLKITFYALSRLHSMIDRFDIIYSQSAIIDFLFVPWILKLADRKIKWFVMVDNLVPPPSKRPGPYLKKLLPYLAFLAGNLLLKKADGLFVVTNYLKEYYQTRAYNVIKTGDGYGIDLDLFKGQIPKNAPRFDALYVGRLHEAKGIYDLVEVVRKIVKINRNFKLGIMGDGEEIVKKNLQDKIVSSKIKKNIFFTGYVTGKQKGDILRSCDFFLFLSYDEGCPHAVIEAFANNKLVVAYDLPIYHWVFKKYIDSGQMVNFKEKDYESIANYIIKKLYKKTRFKNKLQDYTWDIIVNNELTAMQESKT